MPGKVSLFIILSTALVFSIGCNDNAGKSEALADAQPTIEDYWQQFQSSKSAEQAAETAREALRNIPGNQYSATFVSAIINHDLKDLGNRSEIESFLHDQLSSTSDSGYSRFLKFRLLEVYRHSRDIDSLRKTFTDITSEEGYSGKDVLTMLTAAADTQQWDLLDSFLSFLEPNLKGDSYQNYLKVFRAWMTANTGAIDLALGMFEEVNREIENNHYVIPHCDIYWGKTLMLQGKNAEGLEKIARAVLWSGFDDYEHYFDEAYATVHGSTNGRAQYAMNLRNKYAPTMKDFVGVDYEGNEVSLDNAKGQVTLVLFWATICEPCHWQMVNQLETFNKFKDRGLSYVAINLESRADNDLEFIDKYSIPYSFLILKEGQDTWETAAQYGIFLFPTTFLIDSERKILFVYTDYSFGKEKIIERDIEALLQHELLSD